MLGTHMMPFVLCFSDRGGLCCVSVIEVACVVFQ